MPIFNTKAASVESLKKRSNAVVDVFTKTVTELMEINEEIKSAADEKAAEKARIEADLAILGLQESENNRVINKINQIFKP